MWFSEDYFKYVKCFKNCCKNNLLKENVIKIVLHPSVWDYEQSENREKQWAFKKWTGIDEVAHVYMNQPKISDDPAISIELETYCQHGGVRRITYYFDIEGEVVPKSKACNSKIYELNQSGTVVRSTEEAL